METNFFPEHFDIYHSLAIFEHFVIRYYLKENFIVKL